MLKVVSNRVWQRVREDRLRYQLNRICVRERSGNILRGSLEKFHSIHYGRAYVSLYINVSGIMIGQFSQYSCLPLTCSEASRASFPSLALARRRRFESLLLA